MISYKGGSGVSIEEAIIIDGAEDTFEGVSAEYNFIDMIRELRGEDVKLIGQSLHHDGGKSYDKMEIEFENGKTAVIWFDITGFFGKFNLSPEEN